jgi:DNA repair exonuclease SbcCD ATPase subunit
MRIVPSATELKERLDAARLKAARLVGAREADTRQLAEWTDKVAQAKARRSLSEEMTRLFEAMQTRAHSRSVGSFEALLSAVLEDVLPGQGRVHLELSSSNNAPNLDIYIDNEGNLEDVLECNGGAVTNVVCTGLRYAALSRTKNRRLMVLDEPDCWMKPEHIPDFMRVVAEVSNTTKSQTLLISHHETPYFRGRMNVVELVKGDDGKITASVALPLVTDWESDDQPGVRGVRLVNVGAHIDTTLPFFPGATAFIGDNNLGKSTALSTATKAVAYNASDDTLIRHGADMAQITYLLEHDRRLVWTRRRKGSPKVVYALFQGDDPTPLKEGKAPGRGSVPEWVKQELGISEVDGLDLQVGSQKKPVFLLDETASRRARLLSVGRESGHLVQVMDAWGDVMRGDREVVKDGELRVTKLNYRLTRMESLDATVEKCDSLAAKFGAVESVSRNFSALRSILDRVLQAQTAVDRLSAESAALAGLPNEAPVLAEVAGITRVISRIERGQPYKHLELPLLQVEVPTLQDTLELKKVGARIAGLQKYRPLFEVQLPQLPEAPIPTDERHLQTAMARVAALLASLTEAQRDAAQAEKDYQAGEVAMAALQEKLGGVCPLCDQKFEKEHLHVHVE